MHSAPRGTLPDVEYRYLQEQIGLKGWRVREPGTIPVERPRALRKMVEVLYGSAIDYRKLANDPNLAAPMLKQLIDAFEGGDAERRPVARPSRDNVRPLRRSS